MKRIVVKNFGKVKYADIELNNLMLFVGDNNSGKSYLASLIYGLYKIFGNRNSISNKFSDEMLEKYSDKFTDLKNDINKLDFSDDIKLDITKYIPIFEEVFNLFINENKELIIKEIFKNDVDIEELKVEFDNKGTLELEKEDGASNDVDKVLKIIDDNASYQSTAMSITYKSSLDLCTKTTRVLSTSKLDKKFIYDFILEKTIEILFRQNTAYLPVSRTGFMLTYKTLVTNMLENMYEDFGVQNQGIFTKATNDFLINLSRIDTTRNVDYNGVNDVIKYIEQNVIAGKIGVSDSPTPDYSYIPNGSEKAIPMSISSGVVTEMTPLLLFLKYIRFEKMIIEEPEMCLHPKLQWALTRALIKATNKGKSFILTTHSEAILQHINDMIKLEKHEDKVELMHEFNYDKDDILREKDIKVYQFIVGEDGKTVVESVKCTDDGFIISSFIDNLRQRLKETRAFED